MRNLTHDCDMAQISHVDAVLVKNLNKTFGVNWHDAEVVELVHQVSDGVSFQKAAGIGSFLNILRLWNHVRSISMANWKTSEILERVGSECTTEIPNKFGSKDVLNMFCDSSFRILFRVYWKYLRRMKYIAGSINIFKLIGMDIFLFWFLVLVVGIYDFLVLVLKRLIYFSIWAHRQFFICLVSNFIRS